MSTIPSQPQSPQQPVGCQGQPVQYQAPVLQPVPVQPVVIQQPPQPTAEAAAEAHEDAWREVQVRVFDHSPLI